MTSRHYTRQYKGCGLSKCVSASQICPQSQRSTLLAKKSPASMPGLPIPLPYIPNEILLEIFTNFNTTESFLSLRLVSKRFKNIVDIAFLPFLQSRHKSLLAQKLDTELTLSSIETENWPALSHNRRFLRYIATSQLVEIASLKNPPIELVKIAECLVRLRPGNPTPTIPSCYPVGQTPWSIIKKQLSRFEFRTWLVNLRLTIDHIPFSNILEARKILEDMEVSYDRMKEVSLTGYHMLIVVAATIQYAQHFEGIKTARLEVKKLEKKLDRIETLIEIVDNRTN
ncbi:hypothetical protein BKA69DRAFT_1077137 [Paraphysoderma sedebokerense]|nr:hypothetical protein BKA69DRAFT_1077137 [Paraphysoderma sedebokerense]